MNNFFCGLSFVIIGIVSLFLIFIPFTPAENIAFILSSVKYVSIPAGILLFTYGVYSIDAMDRYDKVKDEKESEFEEVTYSLYTKKNKN